MNDYISEQGQTYRAAETSELYLDISTASILERSSIGFHEQD